MHELTSIFTVVGLASEFWNIKPLKVTRYSFLSPEYHAFHARFPGRVCNNWMDRTFLSSERIFLFSEREENRKVLQYADVSWWYLLSNVWFYSGTFRLFSSFDRWFCELLDTLIDLIFQNKRRLAVFNNIDQCK